MPSLASRLFAFIVPETSSLNMWEERGIPVVFRNGTDTYRETITCRVLDVAYEGGTSFRTVLIALTLER